MREQQVFTAWKEELNWDKRLLERIADPGNLRRAYRKVKSNGGSAGVDGMTIGDTAKWLRTHPGEMRQKVWFGFCFALIFNTHAHLGIAGGFAKATPTLAHASPRTAPPGAKRPQKSKKPKHA